MTWSRICGVDEIVDGEMQAHELQQQRIAVFRSEGEFYAISNVCTHAFAMLTDGWLDGLVIECPLHGAQFDITTGMVLTGPAEIPLRVFQVRVADGFVEVNLSGCS